MTRTALLPALMLSLTLVAAGCGGDDEPEAEPITKAEFVEKADQICADGNAEMQTEAEALGDAPSQEEIEAFAADVVVPNIQDQHDALADLGAPEGDEDEVEAILTSLQEGLDAIEADPSMITSEEDPLAEASELAGDYGLTECAS